MRKHWHQLTKERKIFCTFDSIQSSKRETFSIEMCWLEGFIDVIWRNYLTSAPSPSLKPSANLELVLWNTQALSTAARNLSAVSLSSVTMTSVCPDPYLSPARCHNASLCVSVSHLCMCSTAASMLGTISTVQLRSPYSLASFSALERVKWRD